MPLHCKGLMYLKHWDCFYIVAWSMALWASSWRRSGWWGVRAEHFCFVSVTPSLVASQLHGSLKTPKVIITVVTRSSAIAEEPRDALCQLKYYGRLLTELLRRSSADAQEPCEHTVSWNRVKCHTNVRRIACENVCKRWMTFRVIQGHCRCYYLVGHILFHISLPL